MEGWGTPWGVGSGVRDSEGSFGRRGEEEVDEEWGKSTGERDGGCWLWRRGVDEW